VKKLGMSPIQRDGMEYEFTVFMDIDQNHIASSTKDRTTLFDGQYFKPSKQTGKLLTEWLEQTPESQTSQQNTQAAMPGYGEEKQSTAKDGNGSISSPQDGGNAFAAGQVLFAKLSRHKIAVKQYLDYVCKRYGIKSVTDLTGEQIKEQDKLLDSMARPERLKEFKELLSGRNVSAAAMPPVPVIPAVAHPAAEAAVMQ